MRKISRHWKGHVKSGEESNYLTHFRTQTFPKLTKIEGFLDAQILQRKTAEGTEYLIITNWQSIDAIHKFAGSSATDAVVPPELNPMLIDYDRKVQHFEILEERVGE